MEQNAMTSNDILALYARSIARDAECATRIYANLKVKAGAR